MNHNKITEVCYKKFSIAEGNQHIASFFALKKTLDIIAQNKPKNILEVGLGIGSVSYNILNYKMLSNSKFNYYGTESNEFCLNQLSINLQNFYKNIKISSTINEIDSNILFDFIIIDGKDDSLKKIKNIISKNAVIFIEGDRSNQVSNIKQLFNKSKSVRLLSTYKNPTYGPFTTNTWCGGGTVIYLNPTFKQNIHYYKEKLKTFLIYRYRKICLLMN